MNLSGVLVDVHEVESLGPFPYEDDNMGYSKGTAMDSMPAHEQTDSIGMLWSTVGMWIPDDDDPKILHTWSVF